MTSLIIVEAIGPAHAATLQALGIKTCEQLLEQGAARKDRKQIAERTGISEKLVLEWVNHVDLFRIRGVQEQYAQLLEAAGVGTVPELAKRNAENLYQKLLAVNQEKGLVRQPPTQTKIVDWIERARQLRRVITY